MVLMMADPQLAYFTRMEEEGVIIVQDTPKLDLDLYIQNYRGRSRYTRLMLIGRSSVPLAVDALKAAVLEAKQGRDPQRYDMAVEYLQLVAPSEPEASVDQQWLDQTVKANQAETQRLNQELKGYKNNLIKDSIRMGHEDLGKHLESIGDLDGATEAYFKMRPDVSTARNLVDVGKHLVSVSMERRDWGMVISHLSKMSGHQSAEEEKILAPYIRIVRGLADVGQDRFTDAALSFLAVDSSISSSTYNDIASPNDVAVYGGLLSLATMDRGGLQSKVLDNPKFRPFLELEPHIRRAIQQFVNGRYSACIATLEDFRPDYLLDMYIQSHVPRIYQDIRSKCIVQYLIPFSCVTLDSLDTAFARPGSSIEEELGSMIRAGTLKARIDMLDKVVRTESSKPRARLQKSILESAHDYHKQAIERLRRMGITTAGLEVIGKKAAAGAGPHAHAHSSGSIDMSLGDELSSM